MWDLKWLDLLSTKGNVLYRGCVIAFNKNQLAMKSDTPWRSFFGLKDNVKPEWRVIYKPPLSKKVGDLQWRILHGILAVNSFVSKLNVEVKDDCPFCFQRETIFHVFIQCSRLTPFFDFVKGVFCGFNESFSEELFILGFKYSQRRKYICQLLNFIIGQAKMAVYVSRKNKIDQKPCQNITEIFVTLVKSRVLIDYKFYKDMNDLLSFEKIWCCNGALCTILENDLIFAL